MNRDQAEVVPDERGIRHSRESANLEVPAVPDDSLDSRFRRNDEQKNCGRAATR